MRIKMNTLVLATLIALPCATNAAAEKYVPYANQRGVTIYSLDDQQPLAPSPAPAEQKTAASTESVTSNWDQRLDGHYEIIPGLLETNKTYSKKIFNRQDYVTGKNIEMLKSRKSGELSDNRLTLGVTAIGTILHERTNTAGKYPILSQLPPNHVSGKSDTRDFINDISVNATLTLPYVTAFAQGEYTDVEYPGQDQKQLRKYMVTIGDLEKFPAYMTIGKKTVNFGNFASYSPFTHNHSSHYFWAQTDEPLLEIGYATDKTMLAASLIKNDRGLRVINSPENDDKYENFALNASHEFTLNDDWRTKLGAGFLRGTIYDSAFAHHPPAIGFADRSWNGAADAHITLSSDKIDLMAEHTRTLDKWPATDHIVSATSLQGRYKDTILSRPATYSLMASRGIQGDKFTEWEKMDQLGAGLEAEIVPHVEIGAEYLYHHGFVPLILPTITADDGVASHTFIIGGKVTF